MASIHDLYINQGSNYSESVDLNTDYTGYTLTCDLEDSIGYNDSNFAAWDNATTGEFTISLTSTETAALADGIGKYNVEVTSAGGVKTRVLQGRIYVDKDI